MTGNVRRALILGARGQIAPFLATRLAARGYQGVSISRRAPVAASSHPAFPWQPFDLAGHLPWPGEWVDGACLFSSAPLWFVPRHIGMLAAQGLTQIIAFSSTSVYTKARSRSVKDRWLADCLRQAEADLVNICDAKGLPYTILRPTLVYGSGQDRNVTSIVNFVRRFGFFPIASPGRGLRQPVHADDLAAAAVECLATAKARGRAFNLPGGETLTYRQMVERICASARCPLRIVGVPAGIVSALTALTFPRSRARMLGALMLRMNQDLAFDASEAARDLRYHPRMFLAAEAPSTAPERPGP
ncbi:MAG: NAD-dependent epimerase/dehydratase family protein [Acidiferrobacteraceae bacterium]